MLSFDPELTPGARNAVSVCLRIQPSEKVTVITDEATGKSPPAWFTNWNIWALRYQAWVLEELAPRPLGDLPREIVDDLRPARSASSRCRRRPTN